MTFDGKAFGAEIVAVVKTYLAEQTSGLSARLDELEKKFDSLPKAVDLSGAISDLRSAVDAIVIPEIPALPELADIGAMVDEAVGKAVATIPMPRDGKSVTTEDVAPLVSAEVERQVGTLPRPKDGIDGKDGVDGRDGLDVSDLFRAEGGRLIAVMSDGRTKDLGVFVGKDGVDGLPGADGFGFDDLKFSYDGEKTVTLCFEKGDRVKEFEVVLPVVIDRGVYRDGGQYKAGDAVTWAGSLWIAKKDTSSKPDASEDWRLSVKRGRDGRDGSAKEAKPVHPVRVGVPSAGE